MQEVWRFGGLEVLEKATTDRHQTTKVIREQSGSPFGESQLHRRVTIGSSVTAIAKKVIASRAETGAILGCPRWLLTRSADGLQTINDGEKKVSGLETASRGERQSGVVCQTNKERPKETRASPVESAPPAPNRLPCNGAGEVYPGHR